MSDSCRRVVEIEIPPQIVQERAQAVVRELQRRTRLPGFRPGKAPASVIQQRFQDDIRSQVIQELVPEYIAATAREQKWEPVGNPSVSDVRYEEDAPLKFKATVEVLPEFELADYSALKVEITQPEVADDEVEKALVGLRERSAAYVNVDPRPLRDGDFAGIAIQSGAPGKASSDVRVDEILCEIGGPNTVKEFTENLRGAEVGQELSFEVSYRPDHGDRRLAGKSVPYRVKVLGIKQKQLPELNDEFARELGEFDSLDAVRQHIRQDMEKSKLEEVEHKARTEVRKQLVALHDFSVPDTLVEKQIERRLERLRRQLASQGMDPESLSLDWGKVRAAQREEAVEDVKSTFVLEKIAHREQLEPEESEVQSEIERIASVTQSDAATIRSRLTREGGLDRMKSRLRIEKALDFVFQQARKAS
jgi:trigger factor